MEIHLVLKEHVGFHCNVSLLYWRVYNFDIVTLEKKYHEKEDYLHLCHSPLESSSSPPLKKTIEAKLKIMISKFEVSSGALHFLVSWQLPLISFGTEVVSSEEHQRFADLLDRLTVQRDPKAGGKCRKVFEKRFGRGRGLRISSGGRWERCVFFFRCCNYFWTVVRFWGGW